MSWSRFLIVRLVKRRQHTAFAARIEPFLFRPFRARLIFLPIAPGATRYALAPGYHIPRRWRCGRQHHAAPLALWSTAPRRAVGAVVGSTTLSRATLLRRLPLAHVLPAHLRPRANGAQYDSQGQARSASP